MMSDHISLMINGKIIQHGTPKEIYENPNSKEVSNFLEKEIILEEKLLKISFIVSLESLE